MHYFLQSLCFALILCWCKGSCPDVEPIPDFDMEGILGQWYTIQKSSGASPCLAMNITRRPGKRDEFEVVETAVSSGLVNTLGLQHEHHFKGKIWVPNPQTPGVMDLRLLIRTYKLTVLKTDYNNYVGFLLCKKGFALVNNPWIIIASRTPSLDPKQLEPVYAKLLKYNINPYIIETVNQQDCPERGAQGVILKTASNIFGTVKDTIGGIAGIFIPGGSKKSRIENNTPRETGEYEIDVRSSFMES